MRTFLIAHLEGVTIVGLYRSWDLEHSAVLFYDAYFYISSGDSDFGFALYFMGAFVAIGFSKGLRTFSAKEAKVRMALFAINGIERSSLLRIILCLDVLEVLRVIKGGFD